MEDKKEQALDIAKRAVEELKALGLECIVIFGTEKDTPAWGKVAMDWDLPISRAKQIFDYAYSEMLVS